MTDFRPKVLPAGEKEWKGIMPHPIREQAWYRAFDIQDNVVNLHSSPTKLFVEINEGYTTYQGLAIMATAIYLAMNDLDTLLATTTAADHLAMMHDQFYFPHCLGPDDVAPYLEKYIQKKTSSILSNELEIKTISLNDIIDCRDAIVLARNRLEFLPFSTCTITPWEKARRLKKCNDAIGKIDTALEDAKKVNEMVEKIRNNAKEAIQYFEKVSEKEPILCGSVFHMALDKVQEYSIEAIEIFEKFFKYHDFKAWVKEILAITPPAPATK